MTTMYKEIELYPVKALRESIGDNCKYSEMVSFDHSFLCGLLKMKRPQKILEIGVAAGVTSAIVLGCAEELNLTTSLYSLDITKEWYRDAGKETGFVAEVWKEQHNYRSKHARFFGTVAEHIEYGAVNSGPLEVLLFRQEVVCFPVVAV